MSGATLNPSEVLGLALCLLVLLYLLYNKKTLLGDKYAFITYGFMWVVGGFFFTNLEEFFLEGLINVMEHALWATGALYIALGCRRIMLGSAAQKGKAP